MLHPSQLTYHDTSDVDRSPSRSATPDRKRGARPPPHQPNAKRNISLESRYSSPIYEAGTPGFAAQLLFPGAVDVLAGCCIDSSHSDGSAQFLLGCHMRPPQS